MEGVIGIRLFSYLDQGAEEFPYVKYIASIFITVVTQMATEHIYV